MSNVSNEPVKGRMIQFFQGERAKLPTLRVGQPAFCTDDNTFWIGTVSGVNEQFVSVSELQSLISRVEALENS